MMWQVAGCEFDERNHPFLAVQHSDGKECMPDIAKKPSWKLQHEKVDETSSSNLNVEKEGPCFCSGLPRSIAVQMTTFQSNISQNPTENNFSPEAENRTAEISSQCPTKSWKLPS